MAIAKPPKTNLDKLADTLIDQAPAKQTKPDINKTEAVLTVRVPPETLHRIDALVKARRNKIPRHSWLLEAIYEKLDREDDQNKEK